MIIGILIGLLVWFILPMIWNQHVRKKRNKDTVSKFCMVVGLFIVIVCSIKYFMNFIN